MKLYVMTILVLFSVLGKAQNLDQKTKNIVTAKFLGAQDLFNENDFASTLDKIKDIERLTGTPTLPSALNLKVKTLLKLDRIKEASENLDQLYELKLSPEILRDIAKYEETINKRLKLEIEREEERKEMFLDAIENDGFHDGLARVFYNGKYGFIDENGNVVIDFKFDYAADFSEGFAASSFDGENYGFIDTQGVTVVPFKYQAISSFKNGISIFQLNDKSGVMDKSGYAIIPSQYDAIGLNSPDGRNLLYIKYLDNSKEEYKFGLLDVDTGEEITDAIYEEVNRDEESNRLIVKLNGKYGHINYKGSTVIPFEYDNLSGIKDGVVIFEKNEKYGLLDSKGNLIIDSIYDGFWHFGKQLGVTLDKKKGFINSSGEVIIDIKYDDLSTYEDGLARFKTMEKWGFINENGEEVIPAIYDYAHDFRDGYAAVKNEETFYFIDKNGDRLPYSSYDTVYPTNSDYYVIYKNDKWGVISSDLRFKIASGFNSISDFDPEKEMFLARKDDGWGIVNFRGEYLTSFTYQEMRLFEDGRALGVEDGNIYSIDLFGNRVLIDQN